jgi:hypothetical protein
MAENNTDAKGRGYSSWPDRFAREQKLFSYPGPAKTLGAVIAVIICVDASFHFFLFLQAKGREIRMNTALYDCLDSII